MKKLIVGGTLLTAGVGAIGFGIYTAQKNYDCAFCAMMTELWLEQETHPQRVDELQAYMDRGFCHHMFNRPPFDAYVSYTLYYANRSADMNTTRTRTYLSTMANVLMWQERVSRLC